MRFKKVVPKQKFNVGDNVKTKTGMIGQVDLIIWAGVCFMYKVQGKEYTDRQLKKITPKDGAKF